MKWTRFTLIPMLLITVLISGACSSNSSDLEQNPPAAPSATTRPSSTPEPSLTPEPTEELTLMDLDQWDLVWISDSSGWGVAEQYARMIEEDTGKTVIVHDQWVGGLPAKEVLTVLQGGKTYKGKLKMLPDLIPEAEIIVFYGNPTESIDEENPNDWDCTSDDLQYVKRCDPATFQQYISDLEEVYSLLIELRGGEPTILRTFTAYNFPAKWERDGVYDACKECWTNYNQAIKTAAAAYNVPVAPAMEAWTGPDLSLDPNDQDLTRDGTHPNEKGAELIAQSLRELGYEPTIP